MDFSMESASTGKAWFDDIYSKFETILQEVEDFITQTTDKNAADKDTASPGSSAEKLHSKVVQDTGDGSGNRSIVDPQCSHHLESPASENPSSVKQKSCQGVDDDSLVSEVVSVQAVSVEEKTEQDAVDLLKNSSLEESHFTCDLSEVFGIEVTCSADGVCSDASFSGAILQVQSDVPVPNIRYEETIENVELSTDLASTSTIGEQANLPTGELDASSLETVELRDAANPEENSPIFDESLLYAVWRRTQKHRSFKKKFMDSLASKKKLEKEYEQLAIWFGDTDIDSNSDSSRNLYPLKIGTISQSRSSQTSCPGDDSEWEML